MFYARGFRQLLKWINAPSYKALPASALRDWETTSDGEYSFFLSSSKDFLSIANTNIAIRIVCGGSDSWIKSTGLILFDKNSVDKIRPLRNDGIGALGTNHYGMENPTAKEQIKLQKLSFKYRNSSHKYSLDEIANRLCSLTIEDWDSLFVHKKATRVDTIDKIVNYYFGENSAHTTPQALLDYQKSISQ
ncbi:MAG: hypothetical protein K5906_04400 [Bacilli bacterium]|nr:hypothetical protein [Bacilli bacterium]